jgi:N-acetylmuramoyl-L-alanine amidase
MNVKDYIPTTEKMLDKVKRDKNMKDRMKAPWTLKANEYKCSEQDRYLLALTIHCEAGIEEFHGKVAVGTVIMNRVDVKYDGFKTLRQQIYAPSQFSCVGSDNWRNEKPTHEDFKAADLVLKGYRVFGKDVLYYGNVKIASRSFVRRLNVKTVIGRHSFGTYGKGR